MHVLIWLIKATAVVWLWISGIALCIFLLLGGAAVLSILLGDPFKLGLQFLTALCVYVGGFVGLLVMLLPAGALDKLAEWLESRRDEDKRS